MAKRQAGTTIANDRRAVRCAGLLEATAGLVQATSRITCQGPSDAGAGGSLQSTSLAVAPFLFRLYPCGILRCMAAFDISFMRVDRDEDPTIVEGLFRSVEWPALPREGEGLEIGAELDPVTVESVGYDFDGYPNVFVGRIVLDDLQAAQMRKSGWRVRPLPFGRGRG